MLSKYILPGERIELQAVVRGTKPESDTDRKVYQSKVFDILSEERLEITMPMDKTKLQLLPVGKEYDMYFYAKSGLYQCFARIIDRYKSNNVYILALELTSNLRKFQRREYYRFSCALEMETRPLEEEEVSAVEKNGDNLVPGLPLQRSIVVDISGGGIRFVADRQYEVGSLVYCRYQLIIHGNVKEYNVVGKVLNSHELEKRSGMYEHRIQYLNITEAEREEIIRYIFEEERKSRQRERES
ncbi:MAG: flagellar brake protein [Lachnospiraceae bacterium]|nr:flagellar brake protein [Lachnospiraceae bacterium]